MEKRLIVYLNSKPVMKFYVKPEDKWEGIEKYFADTYPEYRIEILNEGKTLAPYDFSKITKGEIRLYLKKNLGDIPAELLEKIVYDFSVKDLLNLCSARSRDDSIKKLCQNKQFWMRRFKRDYPFLADKVQDWKKDYLLVTRELAKATETVIAYFNDDELYDYFFDKIVEWVEYAFTNVDSYDEDVIDDIFLNWIYEQSDEMSEVLEMSEEKFRNIAEEDIGNDMIRPFVQIAQNMNIVMADNDDDDNDGVDEEDVDGDNDDDDGVEDYFV